MRVEALDESHREVLQKLRPGFAGIVHVQYLNKLPQVN